MDLNIDELINALRNQIGELHLQVTILSLQLAKAQAAIPVDGNEADLDLLSPAKTVK